MNGMHIQWYRHKTLDNVWRCFSRTTVPIRYTDTKTLMKSYEDMMAGRCSDVLWRKVDEDARRLIWC